MEMKNPTIIAGLFLSLLCLNFKDMTKITEDFLLIPGYEGIYKINKAGIVIALPSKGSGKRLYERRIYDHDSGSGYRYVSLVKDKKKKNFFVHRLISICFIPNPDNKPHVNHKNGIKWDNRVENLEWATLSENMIHAYENGLIPKGEGNHMAKVKKSDVVSIRVKFSLGAKRSDLSKEYKLSLASIHRIIRRQSWKHILEP